MWKSPNGTIRAVLDGTVFRAPIMIDSIKPVVKNWKKPITIARHAYGDVYKCTEFRIPGAGKAELVFTGADGSEQRATVFDFEGAGVLQGQYNKDDSIRSFARSCFNYALDVKQDLWFGAKDTISKKYDHTFKDIFQEIYDNEAEAEVKADGTKDEQLTYVALGDSIVSGVGLADVQYSARSGYSVDMAPNFHGYSPDCYVGKVAAALGLDRDHAINLGLPALTAPDLADMIRYGKMPQMNMASGCEYNYPEFQDYIRKADVVSVQIGSNDAFVPCIVALGNATNWKSEKLAATILAGDLRNEGSGSTMSTIYRSIKAMDLTKAERDATWNLLFSGMSKICDETYPKTTAALISIVQEIRKLNPDAQIILVGYTNPVPLIPCWRSYFNKLNKFEKQIAKTYNLTYVAIPNTETTIDVHPTIKGHQYIANKLVNAIENP